MGAVPVLATVMSMRIRSFAAPAAELATGEEMSVRLPTVCISTRTRLPPAPNHT